MKTQLLTFLILFTGVFAAAQSQLNFDGYQDHVRLDGTDFPPPWTAEVLIRKNQIGAYSHLLTSTDGTSGLRFEQYINSGRVGITSGGVADWQFSYQAPIGEWVHLAFTCDGSNMKLYVDGQETGGTINGTINMPMGMIGLNTTGAGALNAKIDELRIWNTVLPQSSISMYMLDTVPDNHPQYDQLAHYYKFDEGSGTVANDSKGNLNGTVVGAAFCPVVNKDIGATALTSPAEFVSTFSTNTPISFKLTNNGLTEINEDFEVKYSVDNSVFVTETIEASTNPIPSFSSYDVDFPSVDLTGADIHTFQLITALSGDENTANDTLFATSSLNAVMLGDITNIDNSNGEITISSGVSRVKIKFYRQDIFRVEAAPTGIFEDNTDGEITVHDEAFMQNISLTDEGDYHAISSSQLTIRAYKSPLILALYDNDGNQIWEESQPLTFGQQSYQRLSSDTDEHFYGCGMQNGYFAHKNKNIKIENIYGDWGDGDVPNPAPFYMSTAGYGVFRNTYEKGEYSFFSNTTTRHQENRFDAYYFYGPGLKEVLEGYTYVTGRPFMMPRWGLEFGDADCYNDTGTTADVIAQIAEPYRNRDMPGGWILPNDGYSCGYENLEFVVEELDDLGFYTGLWTEDGVGNIAYEVGTAGTRCVKLDVALVGPGYRSAFNSGLSAFNGIEDNSNDRGYIWTVAGWAGTQRFATLWSGDQHGNWENIRFHIPTVIGSGLSGFNAATGDIDGIYSGSGATYVRDLQWKCFTPAMMTISGWANAGKQPWSRGEPYTTYNREYLKLKMQLTPYLYTYSYIAHQTGVPTARAMVLEFPDDPMTYDNTTQYQFMSGEYFLVAPVYSNTTTRDDIYLPEGTWIDYWDGTRYEGPTTLNDYDAPLEKLPLLVKGGAIIPMYPVMLHDRELPKDVITYDIYPKGNSSFTMYEDDGHSKDYRNGMFAQTEIEVSSAASGIDQPIVINVGATTGEYEGKLQERNHIFQVHSAAEPMTVKLDGTDLQEYENQADWENATTGWYYASMDKKGIAYVKTGIRNVDTAFEVRLEDLEVAVSEVNDDTSGITIFPNPTNDSVTIQIDNNESIASIHLFDSTGKLLQAIENEIFTNNYRLRMPQNGLVFFVEVQFEDGTTVLRRIIKNQ